MSKPLSEDGEPAAPSVSQPLSARLTGRVRGSQIGVLAFTVTGGGLTASGAAITAVSPAGWVVMFLGGSLLISAVYAWIKSYRGADVVESPPTKVELSVDDLKLSLATSRGDLSARDLRDALAGITARALMPPEPLQPAGEIVGNPADLRSLRAYSAAEAVTASNAIAEKATENTERLRAAIRDLTQTHDLAGTLLQPLPATDDPSEERQRLPP